MGYIGNQQTEGFSSIPAKQDFTNITGTSLTLSHAVASAEGISLFINNVRQEPTTAYSIGGDGITVTLTGSVVATDDIYVVYNSLVLQTTVPPDASVSTAKIIDGSVTKAKIGTTELDLATIKDSTGTNTAMTIDSSGRVLQPALPSFHVYNLSYGARGSGVTEGTGGTVLNNTGNCYATGTGKFTASVAGRYFISACIQSYDTVQNTDYNAILLKKNGATYGAELYNGVSQADENYHNSVYWNGVVELAVNDYLQVHAVNGARDIQNFFTGYLIG